jgi:hypothetical protein
VNRREIESVIEAVAPTIRDYVHNAMREGGYMRFVGAYDPDAVYFCGDVVNFSGTLWTALSVVPKGHGKPGLGSGWGFFAKVGK